MLDATMNGASLCAIDSRITVTDIAEQAHERIAVVQRPILMRYPLRREREKLTVTLKFLIREPNAAARRELIGRVLAWAEAGGALGVSTRPSLALAVICEHHPDLSALRHMDELPITFATTQTPYWEDAAFRRYNSGDVVPGNIDCCVADIALTNIGNDVITTATFTAGGTTMTFEGLSLSTGERLRVRMDNGLPVITASGASAMDKRTPESDDLLLLPCGKASTWSAVSNGTNVYANCSVKGRYL